MSSPSSPKLGGAKIGALGLGAVALGCAALAAFLVSQMLSAKGFTGKQVVSVVVAHADLAAGTTLRPTDFEVRDWPQDSAPASSFDSVEALFSGSRPPTLTVGLLAGEPVTRARLSGDATGTGVATLVHPNMRAVALQVDDSVGKTGLVYPGASVDIIVTVRDPMGRGPSSRIAVQNARVLTVGADTDVATRRITHSEDGSLTQGPEQNGTFVTLEVSPEDAEVIAIARNEGRVDLALRNGTDAEKVQTPGATPVAFSAFAPAVTPAAGAGGSGAGTQAAVAAGPAPAGYPGAVAAQAIGLPEPTSRTHRRRIQIVASDPDVQPTAPKSSGPIETYHAN